MFIISMMENRYITKSTLAPTTEEALLVSKDWYEQWQNQSVRRHPCMITVDEFTMENEPGTRLLTLHSDEDPHEEIAAASVYKKDKSTSGLWQAVKQFSWHLLEFLLVQITIMVQNINLQRGGIT